MAAVRTRLVLLGRLVFLPTVLFGDASAFVPPASGRFSTRLRRKTEGVRVQPLRPNENTYWVTDRLIAGEYPTDRRGGDLSRRKIRAYLDAGISLFVDLTRPGEKAPYETMLREEAIGTGVPDVEYRRIPVPDFGVPSREGMREILDVIDDGVRRGKKVYVHCRGGIGRTGTTVGCYPARHGNDGADALREVNRLFRHSGRSVESCRSPETDEQERFVREWTE